MIRSMTGYGRAQCTFEKRIVLLEIKSVNHRYFEFSARVPRSFGFLEEKLKSFFQAGIARGKVECFVQIESLVQDEVSIRVNESLAQGYVDAFAQLSQQYLVENDISATTLSRFPDVLLVHKAEADEAEIWQDVSVCAQEALARFLAMREAEGARLTADITARMDAILQDVAFVEERSPQTVAAYNEKLLARMRDLLGDTAIDEQRLLTESAIFADKIAVAEETVRLRSHIEALEQLLQKSNGAVGRKLDFVVQECNREANTIGSKAQDVAIARHVVNIKAEIEKIREQIQNIE